MLAIRQDSQALGVDWLLGPDVHRPATAEDAINISIGIGGEPSAVSLSTAQTLFDNESSILYTVMYRHTDISDASIAKKVEREFMPTRNGHAWWAWFCSCVSISGDGRQQLIRARVQPVSLRWSGVQHCQYTSVSTLRRWDC